MSDDAAGDDATLVLLRRQYLAVIPLRLWKWPPPASLPDPAVVFATVVDHPLAIANPPPAKHRLRFLKVWLGKLERQGTADCSELYERIAELVVGSTEQEDWCYKSYWVSENAAVTLKESTKMVSEATTGLCTWNGALTLSEWVMANRSLFEGKTVVELGSGIGLAGILLAKGAGAANVVLTDHSPDVLDVLRANIALNGVAAEAVHLDWTDGEAAVESLAAVAPDVLIASDVVFDPELCTALAGVIHGLLAAATKACELYIASTVRNPGTLVQFVAELRAFGLAVTPIMLPEGANGAAAMFPRTDAFPVEFHHVVSPANPAAGSGGGGNGSSGSGAGGGGGGSSSRYVAKVGRYGAAEDAVDDAE